jgi:hypothetical protein
MDQVKSSSHLGGDRPIDGHPFPQNMFKCPFCPNEFPSNPSFFSHLDCHQVKEGGRTTTTTTTASSLAQDNSQWLLFCSPSSCISCNRVYDEDAESTRSKNKEEVTATTAKHSCAAAEQEEKEKEKELEETIILGACLENDGFWHCPLCSAAYAIRESLASHMDSLHKGTTSLKQVKNLMMVSEQEEEEEENQQFEECEELSFGYGVALNTPGNFYLLTNS